MGGIKESQEQESRDFEDDQKVVGYTYSDRFTRWTMIEPGEKRELGNCPRCGAALTSGYGVVRCTQWACDFIAGLREFIEGKHIRHTEEESLVERNLVNIEKEEKARDRQFRAKKQLGVLGRLGFGR